MYPVELGVRKKSWRTPHKLPTTPSSPKPRMPKKPPILSDGLCHPTSKDLATTRRQKRLPCSPTPPTHNTNDAPPSHKKNPKPPHGHPKISTRQRKKKGAAHIPPCTTKKKKTITPGKPRNQDDMGSIGRKRDPKRQNHIRTKKTRDARSGGLLRGPTGQCVTRHTTAATQPGNTQAPRGSPNKITNPPPNRDTYPAPPNWGVFATLGQKTRNK